MAQQDPVEDQFFLEEINGACSIGTNEGEAQEDKPELYCYVAALNRQPANLYPDASKDEIPATDKTAVRLFRTINIWGNYHKLREIMIGTAHAYDEDKAFKIAYIRSVVIDMGLVNPEAEPKDHNVRYNEAKRLKAEDKRVPDTAWWVDPKAKAMTDWMKTVRSKIRAAVALVAYFFRIRGHHWQQDFNDRYSEVWSHCQYPDMKNDIGIEWKYVAREGVHAIFPKVLDDTWKLWCRDNLIPGALIKRLGSAAAGTAVLVAVRAGYDDIKQVFPNFNLSLGSAIAHLVEMEGFIALDRWAGSVNASMYGAPRLAIDEGRLAPLAAVILACLEQFAPSARLRDSRAMQRAGGNAPVTGFAMAKALGKLVSDNPSAALTGELANV